MRKLCYCGALALVLGVGSLASGQRTASPDADVQFKAAQQKEIVEGDLKGAIDQYLVVVAHAGTNRALAAQALLRVAECYRKQGDAQARSTYERIVRDYPDQKDVLLVARQRLGPSERKGSDTAVALRKVWTGDLQGTISPDGRLLSYMDRTSGNLMLHDFTTGVDRALTDNPMGHWPESGEFAEESAVSRDGARVAYTWYLQKEKRYELRLINVQANSAASARSLFGNGEVAWVAPEAWSPDGRSIAVSLKRTDRTAQIGIVNVADGAFRPLQSVDWRGPKRMFFSPNGQYLAYDLPASDTAAQRDVFVIAVDGSSKVTAVEHSADDRAMGWSPDGTYLLFGSDRGRSVGLWAVGMAGGKPHGPARLVKASLGSTWSIGVTNSGALYIGIAAGTQDIEVVTVDVATGKQIAAASRPIQRYVGSSMNPLWSPDGSELAFYSRREAVGNEGVLSVLNMQSGATRDLATPLQGLGLRPSAWSPDGRWIAGVARDSKGRSGIFQIDARTGQTSPILISNDQTFVGASPEWSRDGTRLYYREPSAVPGEVRYVERDLATGKERDVAAAGDLGRIALSPDGQWIATVTNAGSKRSGVALVAVQGGTTRQIFAASTPRFLDQNSLVWMPDGKGLIVRQRVNGHPDELWFLSVSGGESRRLDVDGTQTASSFSVNADGHRIALMVGDKTASEVWVLENFLSALKAKP